MVNARRSGEEGKGGGRTQFHSRPWKKKEERRLFNHFRAGKKKGNPEKASILAKEEKGKKKERKMVLWPRSKGGKGVFLVALSAPRRTGKMMAFQKKGGSFLYEAFLRGKLDVLLQARKSRTLRSGEGRERGKKETFPRKKESWAI